MPRINQFLPTLSKGDAIGYEVMAIQKTISDWGFDSNIYVRECDSDLKNYCQPYIKYKPKKNDLTIFHFAISSELTDFVAKLKTKKIMIYHNITPAKFLRSVNESTAKLVENGRRELESLNNVFDLALGDSEYNRQELKDVGFRNTGVLPLMHDLTVYDVKASKKIIQAYDDDSVNIIFVGKIYPHKKQEDVIKSFYCYKKYINQKARLFLVGHCSGAEKYQEMLLGLIKDLDLSDVYITGFVKNSELAAYYKLADVFLSMSHHEGFCVPLLESMYFKIPIIAFSTTAIPYTLNGSSLTVENKNYLEIAELINVLVTNKSIRENIIERQNQRLKDFDISKIKTQLRDHLEKVL